MSNGRLFVVTPLRRVYVCGYRLHHGGVGALLTVIGAALAYHDRHDWPWPVRDRTEPHKGTP